MKYLMACTELAEVLPGLESNQDSQIQSLLAYL